MWKIPLFKPDYSDKERKALTDVFDSGWLSMGVHTSAFENSFSAYLGNDKKPDQVHSVAVSNCTAALHMALLVNSIGPGDEVIVPATTFIADLNVVLMTGATPVVVDATSLTDWNMSVKDLKNKITSKTRAIIAVHYAGYPFDYEIVEIARKKKILLIEDCAHAVGASINGQKCGTLGDIAAFSFYANKNLAVGEGGMLVCRSEPVFDQARLLRSHGMTALSLERNLGRTISYDVMMPGLNYRISEFNSAIGIEQLKKLNRGNQKRKTIVERYISLLTESKLMIPFTEVPDNMVSAYHIFPVLLPERVDRKMLIEKLKAEGIQTSIHYPAFREFSYYKGRILQKTPVADMISSRVLTLPLYPAMTLKQVEYVSRCLMKLII